MIDINSGILSLIALFNIGTVIALWYNSAAISRTQETVLETQQGLKRVEKATDGIVSALVEATAKSERAAGLEEGRITGELKAADLAKQTLADRE